jgi:antibiotic biosynthesis monooxygenase (ABM) superfamily enzyme
MVVMIPLVTYIVMPLAVRLFSRWLFPIPEH